MSDWSHVGEALLGSWPSQVASWGREGIAAYCTELEARGLTPDDALRAIRSADEGPAPTAPALVKLALTNPDDPTWPEAYSAIYDAHPPCGGRGILWTAGGPKARLARAYEISPLLGAFVKSKTVIGLELLEVNHDEYGAKRRQELKQDWEEFVKRNAHRDRAALAAGQDRELGRGPQPFDPAAALGINRQQIEETTGGPK